MIGGNIIAKKMKGADAAWPHSAPLHLLLRVIHGSLPRYLNSIPSTVTVPPLLEYAPFTLIPVEELLVVMAMVPAVTVMLLSERSPMHFVLSAV